MTKIVSLEQQAGIPKSLTGCAWESNGISTEKFPGGDFVKYLRGQLELNVGEAIDSKKYNDDLQNPEFWLGSVKVKDDFVPRSTRVRVNNKTLWIKGERVLAERVQVDEKGELSQAEKLELLCRAEAELRVISEKVPEAYALLHGRVNRGIKKLQLEQARVLSISHGLGKLTKDIQKVLKFKGAFEPGLNLPRGKMALPTTVVVMTLIMAACMKDTPTVEANSEGVNTVSVATETIPTESPTEMTPTDVADQTVIEGSKDMSIKAVAGVPGGFGGPSGEMETVSNSVGFQKRLNEQGYAPIVQEGVAAYIIDQDGVRTSIVNLPDRLYNPDVVSGQDDRLESDSGIVFYGDKTTGEVKVKAVAAISLNGFPEDWVGLASIVVDESNPAGLGAIRLLLTDEQGNIMAELQGAFKGSDKVELRWESGGPLLYVNGELQEFELKEKAFSELIEMGFEAKKVDENWMLFDGDNQMGQLIQKDEQIFLEVVIDEKIHEVNVDEEKVFEYKTGVTVVDLDQKTESGYELGAVWREGEWREIMLDYEPGTDGRDFDNMPRVKYDDFERSIETKKLLGKQLSDEILPVNDFTKFYNSVFIGLTKAEAHDYQYVNTDKYPAQPVFFDILLVEDELGNEIETVMITWAIKDKSGSEKLLHMIGIKDFVLEERSSGYLQLIDLSRSPEFNTMSYLSPEQLSGLVPTYNLVNWLNLSRADEINELMLEWQNSDIFPEDLETAIFILTSFIWKQTIISS